MLLHMVLLSSSKRVVKLTRNFDINAPNELSKLYDTIFLNHVDTKESLHIIGSGCNETSSGCHEVPCYLIKEISDR